MVAVSALKKLLAADAPSPGVIISAALQQAWTQALQAAAAQHWDALTLCQQAAIRDAYVERDLGNIAISYSHTIGPNTILDGLLVWEVTDISFKVDINKKPVVTTLAIAGLNHIQCVVDLPKMSGQAWLATYPGPLYWQALAASAIICACLGIGCTLLAEVIEVGVFLANSLDLDLGSPHIVADQALGDVLTRLAWRFPLAESPVTDQFVSSEASGVANTYVDAISAEDPQYSQTNLSEEMIMAEDQLTYRYRELVSAPTSPPAFPDQISFHSLPCHLYAGFGVSQNYLNLPIN